MGSPDRGNANYYRLGLLMFGVVPSFALLIYGGALAGEALDKRMGTPPWLTIAGLAAGVAACILEMWAVLKLWKRK